MVNVELTERQAAIVAYISARIAANHYPPTIREIAAEFGISSPNGVACHLSALQKKGVLVRAEKNRSRSIVLAPVLKPPANYTMPWLGYVK